MGGHDVSQTYQSWLNIIAATCFISTAIYVLSITLRLSENDLFFRKKDCLGAPYIYATTHDQVPNVLKYSRNGCLLSQEVLNPRPIGNEIVDNPYDIPEYRAMILGKYKNIESLYIADAQGNEVLIYGGCSTNGTRNFVTVAVSQDKNPGLNHVYGLATDSNGNLYVSNEKTDNVLRFAKDSFEPLSLPPALQREYKSFIPGTFWQPLKSSEDGGKGVRAIVKVKDQMWVANEAMDGVAVVEVTTGMTLNIVVIPSPIGMQTLIHYLII